MPHSPSRWQSAQQGGCWPGRRACHPVIAPQQEAQQHWQVQAYFGRFLAPCIPGAPAFAAVSPACTTARLPAYTAVHLPEQVSALRSLGLNIRKAKVAGDMNEFYITESVTSEKVIKSARLEEIRVTVMQSLKETFPVRRRPVCRNHAVTHPDTQGCCLCMGRSGWTGVCVRACGR
uniref:Uncharacterized protein n=1 Tax=Chlamydomonas euryale TaxID=1486919 RepID=A0A7R9VPS9_9CHLO|mmetsp:Transcript_41627/g.124449  ORF Transcript_41627/g.124449 Transcript_41627/m.124449 type:complete len:176 (+) Transcript_41627:105-632(+)